jgi:hypothetical protein
LDLPPVAIAALHQGRKIEAVLHSAAARQLLGWVVAIIALAAVAYYFLQEESGDARLRRA